MELIEGKIYKLASDIHADHRLPSEALLSAGSTIQLMQVVGAYAMIEGTTLTTQEPFIVRLDALQAALNSAGLPSARH